MAKKEELQQNPEGFPLMSRDFAIVIPCANRSCYLNCCGSCSSPTTLTIDDGGRCAPHITHVKKQATCKKPLSGD